MLEDSPSATQATPARALASALQLVSAGFKLVPLPWGQKGPRSKGWNQPDQLIGDLERARQVWSRPHNVGIHLGASGLVSLDIDDHAGASAWLAERGLDLAQLIGQHPHPIIGRGVRLPFRLPGGVALQRQVLSLGGRVVLELRAGQGCQDVAPGSLHPDGFAYHWGGRGAPDSVSSLPVLPDVLLDLAAHFGAGKAIMEGVEGPPVTERSAASASTPSPSAGKVGGIIGAYLSRVSPAEVLGRAGYVQLLSGRWLSPDSTTGHPGVNVFEGRDGRQLAYCHHAGSSWYGRTLDAFGLLRELIHAGQLAPALSEAALVCGIERAPAGDAAADQAGALWRQHGPALLERFSALMEQSIYAEQLPLNARASLESTLAVLVNLAGDHAQPLREPLASRERPWVGRGAQVGRRALSWLLTAFRGHASDVRARLAWLEQAGVLKVEQLDPSDPNSVRLLVIPVDPSQIELVLPDGPPQTRARRMACTDRTQESKEHCSGGEGQVKAAPAPLLSRLATTFLALCRLPGKAVDGLAVSLGRSCRSVEHHLGLLEADGWVRGTVPLRSSSELLSCLRDEAAQRCGQRLPSSLRRQLQWSRGLLEGAAGALAQRLRSSSDRIERALEHLAAGCPAWSLLS